MIAAAFAVGVALGVASSLAPGPCGLAVLTATRRRQRRRAVGIGVGAALGDAACASLASAGIGAWLADQAGSATLAQQEQITHTLGDTARDLVAATQRQAETTIAEVTRLMQTAAEAPRAAAEVIGRSIEDVARHRQVLCITHLPQIAALAETAEYVRRHKLSMWIWPEGTRSRTDGSMW